MRCQVAENPDKTELGAHIKRLTITEIKLPKCNFRCRLIGTSSVSFSDR